MTPAEKAFCYVVIVLCFASMFGYCLIPPPKDIGGGIKTGEQLIEEAKGATK